MRATGNASGQVKPKPAPAASWAERKRPITGARARSSVVPLKSPTRSVRPAGAAASSAASRPAAALRRSVVKPEPRRTRTEGRWAT